MTPTIKVVRPQTPQYKQRQQVKYITETAFQYYTVEN